MAAPESLFIASMVCSAVEGSSADAMMPLVRTKAMPAATARPILECRMRILPIETGAL
jgi:hypothetical protein